MGASLTRLGVQRFLSDRPKYARWTYSMGMSGACYQHRLLKAGSIAFVIFGFGLGNWR